MRKTLIICFVLLLTIAFLIFSIVDSKKKFCSFFCNIEKMEQTIKEDNLPLLQKKTNSLQKEWEKNSKTMSLYFKRKNLDQIYERLIKLKSHIKSSRKDKIEKDLDLLKLYCNKFKKETTPNFFNIF